MTDPDITPRGRADAEALLDLITDEPCGENSCHCHCGQSHACACDCWRCDECGQGSENCHCAEEEQ